MSQNECHQASNTVHVNKYFDTNWDEVYMAEKRHQKTFWCPTQTVKAVISLLVSTEQNVIRKSLKAHQWWNLHRFLHC